MGRNGWCAARTPGSTRPPGCAASTSALRPGGVAVFWSPERYPAFEAELAAVFGWVDTVAAVDVIDGRPLDYTMYVGRREDGDVPAGGE